MGTVLVVNPHGAGGTRDKEFARWYNKLDPNIGFVSEMGQNDTELRKTHMVLTGRGSRGLEDTAIVLRRGAEVKHEMIKVTRDWSRPVAPDRWVSRGRQPRKQLLSVHANAVIQDPKTGGYRSNPWARDWAKAMRKISRMCKHDTPTLLGGDLNWHHHSNHRIYHQSPEWLAKFNHLDFTVAQVIWLMWDRDVWSMTDRQVIDGDHVPVGVNEENPHPALLVELTRK